MSADHRVLDVLMHVPFEGPGAIADLAARNGLTVRVHRLFDGAPVPDVQDVARLVVMGGPMGAFDDDDYPWLPTVRGLLAATVERDIPTLGVCLGAQLLAASQGARVFRGPRSEIGLGSVTLDEQASRDPVLGNVVGDRLDVFHWHQDTFDLPSGATLLASSDGYRHQAFRIANAWGFQFHVELRAGDAPGVTAQLGPDDSVSAVALAQIEPVGALIIDAFLRVAGGGR